MSLSPRVRTFALGLLAAGLYFATSGSAAFAAAPFDPIPPGISNTLNNLADQPATHTGVVFDRSEMQLVQSVLQQGGMDPDRAATALKSISFDTYRYKEPAFYTPETLAQV